MMKNNELEKTSKTRNCKITISLKVRDFIGTHFFFNIHNLSLDQNNLSHFPLKYLI